MSIFLMSQEHRWHYFAFNHLYLAKGKIDPVVLFPHEAKYNIRFYMGGSGLDQIQFCRIKSGLGLKNFTVHSSLAHMPLRLSDRNTRLFRFNLFVKAVSLLLLSFTVSGFHKSSPTLLQDTSLSFTIPKNDQRWTWTLVLIWILVFLAAF